MLFRLFTLLLSFTLFSQEYEITSENIEIDTELNTINYEYNVIFKSDEIFFTADSLKLNQKNESRRKLYFSAAASTGLILFGLIIF